MSRRGTVHVPLGNRQCWLVCIGLITLILNHNASAQKQFGSQTEIACLLFGLCNAR